jgi:hypothetical protein
MFQGVIPSPAASVIRDHVRGWGTPEVWVGCSGTFKIERALSGLGLRLHSNDVTLYSAAVAHALMGRPFTVGVRASLEADYGWLTQWMNDPADTAATVMLASSLLAGVGGPMEHHRVVASRRRAFRDQWDRLHPALAARLRAAAPGVDVTDYRSGDVLDLVESLPLDAAFVAFPPSDPSTAHQFDGLHTVFDWERAAEEVPVEDVARRLEGRTRWCLVATLSEELCGMLGDPVAVIEQRGARPVAVHASSDGATFVPPPSARLEPLMVYPIAADDPVDGPLTIRRLDRAEYAYQRAVYMGHAVAGGRGGSRPDLAFAVLLGGRLIGCVAWRWVMGRDVRILSLPGPSLEMIGDFAVPGGPPRLSKLVVAASLSREMHDELVEVSAIPFRSARTSVFSENLASMKYRGLWRKEAAGATELRAGGVLVESHRLTYVAALDRWTLEEALSWWKGRG